MTDQTVAKIILQQLGGNRFIMMTGAKNLLAEEDTLRFAIPLNRGINRVAVTLDLDDTYRVTFERYSPKKLSSIIVHTEAGVYADNLRRLFVEQTGLFTSL